MIIKFIGLFTAAPTQMLQLGMLIESLFLFFPSCKVLSKLALGKSICCHLVGVLTVISLCLSSRLRTRESRMKSVSVYHNRTKSTNSHDSIYIYVEKIPFFVITNRIWFHSFGTSNVLFGIRRKIYCERQTNFYNSLKPADSSERKLGKNISDDIISNLIEASP